LILKNAAAFTGTEGQEIHGAMKDAFNAVISSEFTTAKDNMQSYVNLAIEPACDYEAYNTWFGFANVNYTIAMTQL
jgi:hypothetical protein